MILDIRQEGKGQIEIFSAIPHDMKRHLIETAEPLGMKGTDFSVLMQEFRGEGFSAWYSQYWMKGPVVLSARGDIAILELRIAIRNLIRGTWETIPQAALQAMYFQMGFTPHVLTRAIFDNSLEYTTFDIHFTLGFLEKLGIDYKSLGNFIEKVLKSQPAELSKYPHKCTPRMMSSVFAVLSNSYSLAGKRNQLRPAIENILIEALEVVGRDEMANTRMKPGFKKKIDDARYLIESDYPEYRGSGKICQATGLNLFSLNAGFRKVHGTTPYDYYMDLKLEHGKQLLREGNTVVETAYILGYETATPFIERFKEKFHFTPKEFQKFEM